MKKTIINLKVTNNTSFSQAVSLFGIVPNQNSANNSNIMYSFDMSAINYNGINSAIITYTSIYSGTPTTVQVAVLTQSIAGVVEALNTLNIGLFNFSGTTIYVSSNTYSYSNLIVGLPFVSTWDTSNISIGSSANNQIALPLDPSGSYNFFVDWGDGTNDIITSWNQLETTHTYSSIGIYTISIYGECKGIYFNNTGDKLKILSVATWGDFELTGSNGGQFFGCTNLDLTFVSDVLNFGNCTSCAGMFEEYSYTTINNIELWDTSNIIDMGAMFQNATSFNQPLSSWNVSSVTNMQNIFTNAISFNQDINNWDVSNVVNMGNMFNGATSFNKNVGSWDVSSVTDMRGMFAGATSFNKQLFTWNTTNVADMSNMFDSATSFNAIIGGWAVENVTNMSGMFNGATAFNQNIGSWNVSNVSNFGNFMTGKTPATFSATNLDAIYNDWSSRPVKPNINITFGTAKYTAGASAGRAILTGAPNNWTITDGGI